MCSWRSRMASGRFGWVANSLALKRVPEGDSRTGGRGLRYVEIAEIEREDMGEGLRVRVVDVFVEFEVENELVDDDDDENEPNRES